MALSSAARKFLRGVEQVKTLSAEVDAFESGGAYTFSSDTETIAANHLVFRCYATEHTPVPDDWALLAGEAIQNLRASLDHVVYAGTSKPSDQVQFPICTDATRFRRAAVKRLDGVPADMQAAIERAQPYQLTPEAPDRDALSRLQELSNVDKHRALTAVASAVRHESVHLRCGIDIEWTDYATHKSLRSGKMQISAFTARSSDPIVPGDVHPRFRYQVRIEDEQIAVLAWIARTVYRVLAECETGRPLSPFAQYPI